MMILLALLFVLAVAIGSHVALAVARALLPGSRPRHAVAAPVART